MAREVDPAIEVFSRAEELWPDYYNVAEIKRLQIDWRDKLSVNKEEERAAAWQGFNRNLLSKYS